MKRSKTSAASSGPGEPSGWYWTVSIGSVRWRRPSTEPSLRLRWLTLKPDSAGDRLADHLDLVVLRGDLDAARCRGPAPDGSRRGARSAAVGCPRPPRAPRSGGRGRCPAAAGRRRSRHAPAPPDRRAVPGRRDRARGPVRRRPTRALPPRRRCAAERGRGRRGGAAPERCWS